MRVDPGGDAVLIDGKVFATEATVRALLAERGRIARALCPSCGPAHVLDNGRVWGLCGLQRLMRDVPTAIPEADVAAMIRALSGAVPDKETER